MTRAIVTSEGERHPKYEPLYDLDPQTGASIEVFFADRVLAEFFGTRGGWFWWSCQPGCLPDGPPIGPFATSYRAYRDAGRRLEDLMRSTPLIAVVRQRLGYTYDHTARCLLGQAIGHHVGKAEILRSYNILGARMAEGEELGSNALQVEERKLANSRVL